MSRSPFGVSIGLLAAGFVCSSFGTETPAPLKSQELTELPLEALMEIEVPTVYGASKFEQKITAAPSSITIIRADEIKRYGYRTLAEVLQSVQGFYVSYDRNYAFLGSRGVNLGDFNSRILLLINGHRLNNNLTDGAQIDSAFALDVDLIDRVEVIPGPGSVLYGNNAFFGVINVITREGKELKGTEVSGEYGSFDSYKARITYGRQFTNGVHLMLSGSYYESAGPDRLFYPEFNTPAQNNGVAHRLDGDRFGSGFGSVGFGDFTLEGAFIEREKENPTAQYGTTFNDPRLRTVDTRGYTILKYAHQFEDVVDVSANVYYDYSGFNLRYPEPAPFNLFEQQETGEWAGGEVQLTRKIAGRHVISLGGEYRYDFRQDNRLFQPGTTNEFTDAHAQRKNYGIYAQSDFAVRTNLHLSTGVRYDQYGHFTPSWSPRAAVIYDVVPQSTLKFIYGTAFRDPNFLELSDPRFQDIEPEKITSWEVVYEQGIGHNLRSSVSGYYNQIDHLINFENGAFTNFNADTMGLTLALEGKWDNGIRTRLSYSLQHSEERSTGDKLPDSPEHLLKLNASVPVWKDKVFAGIEVQYTSRRHTIFTDFSGTTLAGADAPAFAVVNLTLFSQNLVRNLEASASIYNLLDTTYYDPATRFHLQDLIQQEGRTFRVKLTYRF